MSDHWLRYVPQDPRYRPTDQQARAAEELLASFLPESDDVRSEFQEHTVFFDPGSNWSGVLCSSCGADAESWWSDAMRSAAAANFTDLTRVAACCGTLVSLNNLNYAWPCAFGRYALAAKNPKKKGLTLAQTRRLADALGCGVHEVPVHL